MSFSKTNQSAQNLQQQPSASRQNLSSQQAPGHSKNKHFETKTLNCLKKNHCLV